MRDEHCSFAVLNGNGRCIADCYYNWNSMFEHDCKGITRLDEDDWLTAGREAQITGVRSIWN